MRKSSMVFTHQCAARLLPACRLLIGWARLLIRWLPACLLFGRLTRAPARFYAGWGTCVLARGSLARLCLPARVSAFAY